MNPKTFQIGDYYLEHDGEEQDKRLHVQDNFSYPVGTKEDWQSITIESDGTETAELPECLDERDLVGKEQYEKIQDFATDYILAKPDYDIYFSTDLSSYEYWKGDNNYLNPVIAFHEKYKTPDDFFRAVEESQIIADLDKAINEAERLTKLSLPF